jgi:menaquinone-dependent protoporphyrinogen IX oxidase
MSISPEEYRTRAAECLRSAPTMLDSLARDTLVHMAAHWARLADFHEASRNLQDIQQVVVGAPVAGAHAHS